MKENVRKIIGIIIAYIYLLVGYSYIIYYVSYTIRITCKPLGWAMMLAIALMFFIAYVIINHILLRRILSKKLLVIVEVALLVSILTLVWSDISYEHCQHLMYLKRTAPVIVD